MINMMTRKPKKTAKAKKMTHSILPSVVDDSVFSRHGNKMNDLIGETVETVLSPHEVSIGDKSWRGRIRAIGMNGSGYFYFLVQRADGALISRSYSGIRVVDPLDVSLDLETGIQARQ